MVDLISSGHVKTQFVNNAQDDEKNATQPVKLEASAGASVSGASRSGKGNSQSKQQGGTGRNSAASAVKSSLNNKNKIAALKLKIQAKQAELTAAADDAEKTKIRTEIQKLQQQLSALQSVKSVNLMA